MLRIFIGFDTRQIVNYQVLSTSIMEHCTVPYTIAPISNYHVHVRGGLTAFTYARFLVPYLCDYQGWAIYFDCDQLVMDCPNKLLTAAQAINNAAINERGTGYGVFAVKFPGDFEFENASVMVFNCSDPDCRKLTVDYINDTPEVNPRLDFCDFGVGELPQEWNYLVGYAQTSTPDLISLAHYTQGTPAFPEISNAGCDFDKEWIRALQLSNSLVPWRELMGNSKHAMEIDGKMVPRLAAKKVSH